jgi:AraC-like DNA-binding protein
MPSRNPSFTTEDQISLKTVGAVSREPRAAALRPHVRTLWDYGKEGPAEFEQILPTVGGQLLFNLRADALCLYRADRTVLARAKGAALQGPLTKPWLIDGAQKRAICGVQFEPGGLVAFHGVPATRFVDALIDVEEIWGEPARSLRRDLSDMADGASRLDAIEAFLLSFLRPEVDADVTLRTAIGMLAAGETVGEVRNVLGLSQRGLHQLFAQRVGLRPKLCARITRLNAVIESLADRQSWSDLAAGAGFADQAHLVREFGAFTSRSPTSYRPVSADEPTHSPAPPTDEIVKASSQMKPRTPKKPEI